MATVLQLFRRLNSKPEGQELSGLTVRTFQGAPDVALWLALREEAFADEAVPVRRWTPDDFDRELRARSWWRDEHCWFAEDAATVRAVGTVTLAMRGTGERAVPVAHWLAVVPASRRRGVGRLLMSVLETRAWELGFSEVRLETHARWAAAEFYRALGYQPLSGQAS